MKRLLLFVLAALVVVLVLPDTSEARCRRGRCGAGGRGGQGRIHLPRIFHGRCG